MSLNIGWPTGDELDQERERVADTEEGTMGAWRVTVETERYGRQDGYAQTFRTEQEAWRYVGAMARTNHGFPEQTLGEEVAVAIRVWFDESDDTFFDEVAG